MAKKEEDISILLLVFLLVLFVVIYIASLGSFKGGNWTIFPEEFKDTKEEAKRKHKRLKELLDKQQSLKTRLDKRFKWTYFCVRLFFILGWFAGLLILFVFGAITNIGDALNYSEAAILVMLALHFLIFGTISNLENFIDLTKAKIENLVCGKYMSLDEKIDANKEELVKLDQVINSDCNPLKI